METKKKVTAIIERSKDDLYSVYVEGYGFIGYGDTVSEALNDFFIAYKEFKEDGLCDEDFIFDFKYDTASFLQFFKDRMSLANLQAITGINRRQLHHYVSGVSRPSPKTVKRIQEGITKYGEELSKVKLI